MLYYTQNRQSRCHISFLLNHFRQIFKTHTLKNERIGLVCKCFSDWLIHSRSYKSGTIKSFQPSSFGLFSSIFNLMLQFKKKKKKKVLVGYFPFEKQVKGSRNTATVSYLMQKASCFCFCLMNHYLQQISKVIKMCFDPLTCASK